MICPRCNKEFSDPPALSRRDNKTNICPICGVREALEYAGLDTESSVYQAIVEEVQKVKKPKRMSPAERTRAAVYATGNKWARENFEATHN